MHSGLQRKLQFHSMLQHIMTIFFLFFRFTEANICKVLFSMQIPDENIMWVFWVWINLNFSDISLIEWNSSIHGSIELL